MSTDAKQFDRAGYYIIPAPKEYNLTCSKETLRRLRAELKVPQNPNTSAYVPHFQFINGQYIRLEPIYSGGV